MAEQANTSPGQHMEEEEEVEVTEEELFQKGSMDDWEKMKAGLRERRTASGRKAGDGGREEEDEEEAEEDELDEDDPLFTERRRRLKQRGDDEDGPICGGTCLLASCFVLVLLLSMAGVAFWHWRWPAPLTTSLANVRPMKFKIDVTDFFSPTMSTAVQAILSVRNSNLLRALLLDGFTLSVYEASTGLKLGAATQGSLMINQITSTQVTLAVTRLGSSLPQEEQQRLAADFLRSKALLLTFVVAATSRLPIKGSKSTQTSSNTTLRVDFSTMYKDPFFQRAPAVEEPAAGGPEVHDVPI